MFFCSLFIARTQHVIHITCKSTVNQVIMLLVKLPVSSRLFVVQFWGSQKWYVTVQGVGAPNPTTHPRHSRVNCEVMGLLPQQTGSSEMWPPFQHTCHSCTYSVSPPDAWKGPPQLFTLTTGQLPSEV